MCEVTQSSFGVLNDNAITAFTLKSDTVKATILSYG